MNRDAVDVRGDEEARFLLLVHRTTGAVLGAAYRCSDGWWIGQDVTGKPRRCYPPAGAEDPRMHIANQLINP